MTANPRRIKELFVAALDLPDAQARRAFLERECGDDAELRQRLDVLLKAHDDPASALERPLAVAGPATADYHGPAEEVGAIIAGKYKLVENLGQGGMGDVFMAQQTAPVKRLVALKLIKLGMDSRQVLARFEAERQALALMDHPNIAKVLDAGATESGRPFFVMELVKGVPITRFCDERQLSPRERLELFIPVCQAIQHAHQKGVIHRDIKPSNVMVALYDDRPVPKVIDFGVAKAAGTQLTDASLVTGFGTIVGTPEYMSPEQAQLNQLDIDTRSDVYALGVLLYELLTGTTPIDRKRLGKDALLEILRVIREEEPPRPSARLSTSNALASIAATRRMEPAKLARLLRGELDWIVMKCLEKDRSRRYDTANGLARDVERYLADEVVEARPPSAGYRLRKVVRKHRTALAMAATVVLLLLAGVALSTWQAVRARRAEREAAQARDVAEQNEREADEQRKKAETQAASVAMDMDLKYCEDGEIALGLLRLAETLRTMPAHAKELRECAALNILVWGQKIRPAWTIKHDGFAVTQAILSPDGRTVLSLGRDGALRLWDALSGQQRKILSQPLQAIQEAKELLQFSNDGSTALTCYRQSDDSRGVRLWDVATGRLRATLPHDWREFRLSQNGSLLVTTSDNTVFIWNAMTGQLLRKVACQGLQGTSIDVSPDGSWVLISQHGRFAVWSPESDKPLKRLPGDSAVFSPSGRSAASISGETVRWWDTQDWQLHRTVRLFKPPESFNVSPRFITDEVLKVGLTGVHRLSELLILRSLPEIIREPGDGEAIKASRNSRVIVYGSRVYDGLSGQRLPLPRGRRFHPELRQLSEDGRFTPFHDSSIIDLEADKKIVFRGRVFNETLDVRFLKDVETWVVLSSDTIYDLRKADASLDAELLQKWCQVIARGHLDENGRFSIFDEPTWEKTRLELAHLLETNPSAQSLRSTAIDPLYWLRQEIKDLESKDPAAVLPLLDRLVAAEPTWPHYSQRAAVHAKLQHADLAVQDELAAVRLAGERYWLGGSSITDWKIAAQSVKAPGCPREQYERALHWVEARIHAGVAEQVHYMNGEDYPPPRNVLLGLALVRLGRYTDALSVLLKDDLPYLSRTAGLLMSRWNGLIWLNYRITRKSSREAAEIKYQIPSYNRVDLLIRAMCYSHLGHADQAKASLNLARRSLPKVAQTTYLGSFLREAESLIEGKPRS